MVKKYIVIFIIILLLLLVYYQSKVVMLPANTLHSFFKGRGGFAKIDPKYDFYNKNKKNNNY